MQAMSASLRLEREVLVDPPAPLLPPLSDPSLFSQAICSCQPIQVKKGVGGGVKGLAWEAGKQQGVGNQRLLSHDIAANFTA